MNPVSFARQRYTTKAYDASRQVEQAVIDELLELLRLSPSSVNSQPWHFVVASTTEGKARLAKGAQGGFAYNQAKIVNASHVILICVRRDLDDAYLADLLQQEADDGRFRDEVARTTQHNTRRSYVELHRGLGDIPHGRRSRPTWRSARCFWGLLPRGSTLRRWRASTVRRWTPNWAWPRRA